MESRQADTGPARSPWVSRTSWYALGVLVAFVATMGAMAIQAGTGNAILTGLLTVAAAGMTLGVWGAAVAVRETHDLKASHRHPVAAHADSVPTKV